jgi:protein involved in polysaccharide export with SLBB domain
VRVIRATSLFVCLLALAASPLRASAQLVTTDAGGAVLAPGDVVRMAVWGKPEFSGDFLVAANGTITHPLLRDVTVAGVPIPQVEQRVRTFLGRYVADPAFVLTPLIHVFVGGEVRTPGNYMTAPGTTLNQTLVLAGGWTADSQLDRVRLIRNGSESNVDLTVDQGREGAVAIHSGDQVLVGKARHTFRDVVAPTLTFIGAMAGIANLIVTRR